MFFLLSKILDVLATPLAWAIALVTVGLAAGRWRRRATALGLVVLVVFSLEPVSNALFHSLESPPQSSVRPGVTYDAAILLGGVGDDRAEATWGQRAFNDNNERLLETFDLLRSGRARYAIVSGGDAAVQRADLIEARVLVEQLVAWGIDRDRLVVEGEARNTRENAVYSAAIVRARGWHDVVIVTSAFHMSRAYGCFRAVGLAVDMSPVDFRSYDGRFRGELIPRADHLQESTAALREWLGRIVYRLRGYSR